jgi:multicomponent Na+:H+ antiporter subunit B
MEPIVEQIIDIVLLSFMALTAYAVARIRNLYAVVMLAGIYSLLAAAMFVVLDAVDVAFTEAAVGAGISTVLALGTIALTKSREKEPQHARLLPLLVVGITGAALVYGTLDLAHYGDASAPPHHHVAPEFMKRSIPETGIPNVVTSVLASYRGYDTLGEVTVIFTAGIGVILLLGSWRRKEDDDA